MDVSSGRGWAGFVMGQFRETGTEHGFAGWLITLAMTGSPCGPPTRVYS
jgi:hypothetical protein